MAQKRRATPKKQAAKKTAKLKSATKNAAAAKFVRAAAKAGTKRRSTKASRKSPKTPAKKVAAKKTVTRKTVTKNSGATSASARKSVKTAKTKSKSYELKTKATAVTVDSFLASVDNPKRVEQARIALGMLGRVTGEEPKMWGPSIIGFGKYSYVYDSGHSGEMCVAGFSPRKAQFVFYVLGQPPRDDAIWSRLGKFKLGGSCLYVNKFDDIDLGVLEEIYERSVATMRQRYPA